jgi:hypothetical protein
MENRNWRGSRRRSSTVSAALTRDMRPPAPQEVLGAVGRAHVAGPVRLVHDQVDAAPFGHASGPSLGDDEHLGARIATSRHSGTAGVSRESRASSTTLEVQVLGQAHVGSPLGPLDHDAAHEVAKTAAGRRSNTSRPSSSKCIAQAAASIPVSAASSRCAGSTAKSARVRRVEPPTMNKPAKIASDPRRQRKTLPTVACGVSPPLVACDVPIGWNRTGRSVASQGGARRSLGSRGVWNMIAT